MLVVRLRVGNLLEAVLSVYEVVDHAGVKGARAEERYESDDIVEAVRLELGDEVPHAGRLELEHRDSLAGEEVLEGVVIIKADGVKREQGLPLALQAEVDHVERPLDDGERLEPEEVELHEADLLDVVLVELRHGLRSVLLADERCEVRDEGRRYDYASRVLAVALRDALEAQRHVDEVAVLLVGLVDVLELGLSLQGLPDGDVNGL